MMHINPPWSYEPLGPFDTCPECLGPLTPVSIRDDVSFYCADCNACWHVSMGYLMRLDPATCPGFTPPRRDLGTKIPDEATPAPPAPSPSGGR
jgi:hypothetical protein